MYRLFSGGKLLVVVYAYYYMKVVTKEKGNVEREVVKGGFY